MSLMITLALLALTGAAAFRHVDIKWREALSDRWTAELPATDQRRLISQTDIDMAIALLQAIPGIEKATPLEPQEIRRLLKPWLGDNDSLAELPLPILIDIKIDRTSPPAFEIVQQKLSDALKGAKLDNHHDWTKNLVGLARAGEVLGLALFATIMISAMLTVVLAARSRLAVNRVEIELLHVIGASDRYIAKQFQAGAFRSALIAAVAAVTIVGGIVPALIAIGGEFAPLIPELRLEAIDWAIIASVPVCAVLIATVVARVTVGALLRRLL
jgi:cell division transport system permease protein